MSAVLSGSPNRAFRHALALSLVLHAVLLFGISQRPLTPRQAPAPPLVARLAEPPAPAVGAAPAAPAAAPAPPKAAPPPPPKPALAPPPQPKPAPPPPPKPAPPPPPKAKPKPTPPPSPKPAPRAEPPRALAPPTAPRPAAKEPVPVEKPPAEAPTPVPRPAAAPPAPAPVPAPPQPGPAQGPPAPARAQPAPAPSVDVGSLAQYRLQLISAARKYKRYPRVAMDNDWEGEVVVRMVIGANGMISALSIQESSGHEVLDRQALEMFKRAKPLVLIPPALRGREFAVELRAIYSLKDQGSG